MKLDKVYINLETRAFCAGKIYVVLFGCKSIAGLSLTRPIAMNDVKAEQTAIKFYKNLNLLKAGLATKCYRMKGSPILRSI